MDILVGCPTAKMIDVSTVSCIQDLQLPTIYVADSLVYDARNELVNQAIKHEAKYLLFVDSDMIFKREDLQSMLNRGVDICTGLYVERTGEKHRPTVYSNIDVRTQEHNGIKEHITEVKPFFEVKGCGMGFCLINTEVFKNVIKYYGDCFQPIGGLGEDLSFCWRATHLGYKIYCDSTFELGHMGHYTYTLKDWKKD